VAATSAPAGGATITIHGSGFQSGTTATIAGKSATVTFKDANTITIKVPPLSSGPQRLILENPTGETATLDAALTTT
jgi:IPT/TIG domain